MPILPEEAKVLPPPGIINRNSVWLGVCGWVAGLMHNGFNNRPALKAGIHRQALVITICWYLGYHLSKGERYVYARKDREMHEYARQHPEDFPEKEKKSFAEVLEPFHPIR